MEHTVHPLLALVEDNQNGLKLLLKNYIDFTVEQQFDYFKNRILKMMENGLIDPLYSESDHVHLTRKGEQATWPTTPLTNSIYTEPVKKRKGFDDDDGDEHDNEDIMDYENGVNEIGNLVNGNYDNTSDDAEMGMNGLCETQPNVNASLGNNQINSPIINLREDLNIDIDETTENANNLNGESLISRSKSSSTKLNFKNKTRQMPKRRTRQNTKLANKQNYNQQSIASTNSGLRSSSRKRIPKKVFGEDQSSKTAKKVKQQSDVNDDGTDVEEDDDDDDGNMYKSKSNVIILELHCIEPDCDQIFPSRLSWREHMLNVHKINRNDLYHHLANNVRLNHLNQTEHFCTYTNCDAVCKSNSVLNQHWSYYHHPGKFACPSCPFVASLYCTVISHRYAFHGSHRCTYRDCGKVFRSNLHLKRHEEVHIEGKQYECIYENCGLMYKFARNAARHVRVHHFNLPSRIKDQKEKNIIDTRDPLEYVHSTLGL